VRERMEFVPGGDGAGSVEPMRLSPSDGYQIGGARGADGLVTGDDYNAWIAEYAAGTANGATDLNNNGVVDGDDFTAWNAEWDSGALVGRAIMSVPDGADAKGPGNVRGAMAAAGVALDAVLSGKVSGGSGQTGRVRWGSGAIVTHRAVSNLNPAWRDPHEWFQPPEVPRPAPPPPRPSAPGPTVDSSCSPNPLVTCQNDPQVKAALARYSADCANSSRGTTKIVCVTTGPAGSFSCLTNTINLKDKDCGVLAHEILHAADRCVGDDNCGLLNQNNNGPLCDFVMCTEARATALASCCDPANGWRQGNTWAQCVAALKKWYIDNSDSFGCAGVTKPAREAAWDKCAPAGLTEATACNGQIPRISANVSSQGGGCTYKAGGSRQPVEVPPIDLYSGPSRVKF